jgi:uncharacterized protein YuzE
MINNGFFYDENNDILSIHKDFKNGEKFKTNIDIGSIVLDLSNKGRIVGLELMNASDIFKREDFDVTEAKFDADITPKNILIKIFLKTKDSINMLPAIIAVPLDRPLVI